MPEISQGDALRMAVEYYEKRFSFDDAVKLVGTLAKSDIAGLIQFVFDQAVKDTGQRNDREIEETL